MAKLVQNTTKESNNMKRHIRIAAALTALLLVLCSCGNAEVPLRSRALDSDGFVAGLKALDYVDLCDLSSIPIAEADIQSFIDDVLEAYPIDTQINNKALDYGDTASIDYTGYIDGVAFEGGTATNYEITVGETVFIDTFINDLVGMMPGDKRTIIETFPNYYPANESLQGKEASFDVTLNYLIDRKPGEFTDEYIAEKLSADYGWTTTEEMRAGVIQELCYSYVTDNSSIKEIPEAMLEAQKDSLRAYYQSYAEYYEMELEDFVTQYLGAGSMDEVVELSDAYVRQGAEQAMYFQAIAEREGLKKITKKDIREYFKETIGSSDFSSLKKIYGLPYLKQLTRNHKVFELLTERASIQ
jgi:trigger factor